MIKVLGLEATKDGVVDVVSMEGETSPVPSPTTRQVVLRFYLEICGSPTRDTLSLLAQFVPTEAASKELIDLASSHETFKSRVTDHFLTLAQVSSLVINLIHRSSNKSTRHPPHGLASHSPSY
jgi:NADPH-ferrihemoprotein reductase